MSEHRIVTDENPRRLFGTLLAGAIENQQLPIAPATELYLVDLLARFIRAESLSMQGGEGDARAQFDEPLAPILLRALERGPAERVASLRWLGDSALFVAGFFADSFARRAVGVDYYAAMGGGAYGVLAELERRRQMAGPFGELCEKFLAIADLLAEVSERVSLSNNRGLVRLYERWLCTGSRRMARLLAERGVLPTFEQPKAIQ